MSRVKDKGLRLNPIDIRSGTWYYEEKGGISICFEVRDKKCDNPTKWQYIRTDIIQIPWGKIARSVDRWRNSKRS